jgi:hypothetical protein
VGTGSFIASLLMTRFRLVSALAVAFSFSTGVICACGLLVTSTVILRCPPNDGGGTVAASDIGFRRGDKGDIKVDEELERTFSFPSESDPSPVSRTSSIAWRLVDVGSLGAVSEFSSAKLGGADSAAEGETAAALWTGVDGVMLRAGGGEKMLGSCDGGNGRGKGARGGGERTRGGGEKTRWGEGRTGVGDVGRELIGAQQQQQLRGPRRAIAALSRSHAAVRRPSESVQLALAEAGCAVLALW